MSFSREMQLGKTRCLELVMILFVVSVFVWAGLMHGQSDTPVLKRQGTTTEISSQSSIASSLPTQTEATGKDSKSHQAAAATSSDALLRAMGAKVNVRAKSDEILAHLREVTRNYDMAIMLTQRVGEPVDAIYREQSILNAKLVASYAFQAASADAKLATAYAVLPLTTDRTQALSEVEKIQVALVGVNERLVTLKLEQRGLQDRRAKVSGSDLREVNTRLEQTQAAIEFNRSVANALMSIAGISDTHNLAGFDGDIERMKQTAPGMTDMTVKLVPAPLAVLDIARSSGIMGQAIALFQLSATRQTIDERLRINALLHHQAVSLRSPFYDVLVDMIRNGESLSREGAVITTMFPSLAVEPPVVNDSQHAAETIQSTVTQLDTISTAIKTLSASAVPRSQEIIALEQSEANLSAWRNAVNVEYHDVRLSLYEHLLVIFMALCMILIVDRAWQLTAIHKIKDLRRRRQLRGIRRLVTYSLCCVVVVFGFVTHFTSLATFAGFLTAGIAVALQTVLLSVAAYFFVVGRYGIRVGDRVTVASVTGDVVDVGLLRFYLMDLAISGLGLQPTGRVAIFSNAILFQAGTPLYKQMPGTNYAWHEVTVMLKPGENHAHVAEAVLGIVQEVYDGYKKELEQDYNDRQSTMDYGMNAPRLQSRIQLVDGGPQLTVRFPVRVYEASRVTQAVAEAMLKLIRTDGFVRQSVDSQPIITPAVGN